jgi:hypothetical protein
VTSINEATFDDGGGVGDALTGLELHLPDIADRFEHAARSVLTGTRSTVSRVAARYGCGS